MPRVFISHSSSDKPFARKLVNDLEAAGVQVWFDQKVIGPGDSIVSSVSDGLKSSDFTVLIISSSFLNSKWATWETNSAIVDAINANKSSVIPLLIEDVWNDVSSLIRDKLYLDFRNHTNLLQYRAELDKLLTKLLGSNIPVKIQSNPTVMVTGGRDLNQKKQCQVAYELGKLLGADRYRMITGGALGVDEHFARGASEALQNIAADVRAYLTAYITKGKTPHHSYGKHLFSHLNSREEGVPEMVEQADITVLLGGSKNTNYIGVLSLLEGKIMLPVEFTDGAAAELYSLVISRYHKVFGSLLDKPRFEDLADRSRTPKEMAELCLSLIKLVSGT